MKPSRLAIITTHPIQYNAPLFKLMNSESQRFTIKVFYTWGQSEEKIFDPEFGISRDWDIPLLDGYAYTFVKNVSTNPGSHHFNGIVNPTLVEEVQEWRADAILVFGWSFRSHLKAMRYFHGKIPVLFKGDSTLLDEPSGLSVKKLVRRGFLKWVYSYIDYALYVGSANKRYFLAHGIKEKGLLFAPHAIDNCRFSSNDNDYNLEAEKWRVNAGIGEDDIVFLFAGKLTIKKDPELLIQCSISLNHASTWLVVVGVGELEDALKEKYKSFSRIIFIAFQNQSFMPVIYRVGNVFVLPSKGPGETWGLSVNEAMACGRGAIVSDKCGCSADLVVKGETGYIFKHGDVESLEKCMRLTLDNFKDLGANSRLKIESWTYNKTIQQLNVLFDNIVA